jgi:hypothetical protein
MTKSILFILGFVGIANANVGYPIGLYQKGVEAEAIYRLMKVSEIEDHSDPFHIKIFKNGGNILCVKSLSSAPTYFCSAGFSTNGKSQPLLD